MTTPILLPPLPEPMHGFYATPTYTLDQLRARDLEVARVVLEAAAQSAYRYAHVPSLISDKIRNIEVKHHE